MELSRSELDSGTSSSAIFACKYDKIFLLRKSLDFDLVHIAGDDINVSQDGGPITLQPGNYEVHFQGNVVCPSPYRIRFRLNGTMDEESRLLNTFSFFHDGKTDCTTLLMLNKRTKLDVVFLGDKNVTCTVMEGSRLILKTV